MGLVRVFNQEMDGMRTAIEKLEQRCDGAEKSVKTLTRKYAQMETFSCMKGMTNAELVLVFYYLFDGLGVNFSNSDKTQWARFISQVTGRSFDALRNEMSIDFDSKRTKKSLRVIALLFHELHPEIALKIQNDLEPTKQVQ